MHITVYQLHIPNTEHVTDKQKIDWFWLYQFLAVAYLSQTNGITNNTWTKEAWRT